MDINTLAKKMGIDSSELSNYFDKFAKITLKKINPKGKLIVVSSISPTTQGVGKTSLLIGLVDAMNKHGHQTVGALRQPSMGPTLGMKGGATGGGYSNLCNEDLINLNFTGDFHAITSANNLISTIIENEIYFNSKLNIDVKRILWNRCVDLNDRGLRQIDINIKKNLSYRAHFNITAASDLMALFSLCTDEFDFKNRLENTIVAYSITNKPILIKHLNITASVMAILKQAFPPNLVMTKFNSPILMHGGPFANIAHGCNSVIATKTALTIGKYVITECGFGSDLGFEKFMNIKMQQSGLYPQLVIVCVTINALKHHGQNEKTSFAQLTTGFNNLLAHVKHISSYGFTPLIVLNKNEIDTKQELLAFTDLCHTHKLLMEFSDIYNGGLKNTKKLTDTIIKNLKVVAPKFLYDVNKDNLLTKIDNIAKTAYHANKIEMSKELKQQIAKLKFQDYYVCIAKTQYSLSSDANALNWPKNVVININDFEINHAAKFIIPMTGHIWKMPGLPQKPQAKNYK